VNSYLSIYGQFVKFVEIIEGEFEGELPDNTIFFSKFRLKAFLETMQKTGKKPNTIANKAKTFCEVNQFTFLKLQLLKWMKGEDEFEKYLTKIKSVRIEFYLLIYFDLQISETKTNFHEIGQQDY
jgi:hypothetical protein